MEQQKKRKPIFKKWWFWVICIIVFFGVIGSLGGNNDKNTAANNNSGKQSESTATNNNASEKPKKEETKVTYANFAKIKMGAKQSDVESILGKGTLDSSSDIGGIKTEMYSWNGDGISNMNVTIQNGIVTGKAQMGLYSNYSDVTLEKFNKIKEGMTYEQVKAILGEGEITSQSKIMDIESILYSWINKDGSNMNCTFSGGKMEMKAQFNLK